MRGSKNETDKFTNLAAMLDCHVVLFFIKTLETDVINCVQNLMVICTSVLKLLEFEILTFSFS